MKIIWTLLILTWLKCLGKVSLVFINKTNQTYREARDECRLATPSLTYSEIETTVEIGPEIIIQQGEKAWLGYTKDLEVANYLGCVFDTQLTMNNSTRQKHIGQCQSVCKSYKYFGVKRQNQGVDCYCLETLDQKNLTTCEHFNSFGIPFGGLSKVSVYNFPSQKISENLKTGGQWDNDEKRCLSFTKENIAWECCSQRFNFLCSSYSNQTSRLTDSTQAWTEAANECLKSGMQLSVHMLNSSYNVPIWLSYIRSEVISSEFGHCCSNRTKYGYIEGNGENQFILKFGNPSNEFYSLCDSAGVTNSTTSTHMIQEKTSQVLFGSSKTKMSTDAGAGTTNSMRVTTSTQTTNMIKEKTSQVLSGSSNTKMSTDTHNTNSMLTHISSTTNRMTVEIEGHDDTNNNERKTRSNIGVLVGIPVGIFLLVTVAVFLVFLYRKRRISESRKRSKKYVDVNKKKRRSLKVNKANTNVNNVVYIEKNKRDEMKQVDNDVIEDKGWSNPTRKSFDNYSSFILENNITYGMKAPKSDYNHISKTNGQAPQSDICSSQDGFENENSAIPQNETAIGYDYAKVMPRHRVPDAASVVGCGGFKSGSDSDYDHLHKMNAPCKNKKGKYQGADTDIGNIYNKTGSHDEIDMYDHVDDGILGSSKSRCGNVSGNSNQSKMYNKLKHVTHGNNDTYNHVNGCDHIDKQIYFGTKAENMNIV